MFNKKLKMKNYKGIWVAALLLGSVCTIQAQNDQKTITAKGTDGVEQEVELPEAMDQELDSLLNLYNAKAYLKPDADCNMPDVNPTYAPEVYKSRLAKLPTIIEMPYNDIVQKFIDRYSGELRHKVGYMLGAQNFYMSVFEEALDSYGLPLELKYLPVIESALNPQAVSKVGATGLWQFMLTTSKRYGLEVNSLVDERKDVVRSSYAAAHYLSDLYKIFGDWNLVIAAYNCGPEKITKAIHRSKGEKDYWKIFPKLPKETRGYVPAFIAANYIMNYYCDHNICPLSTTLPAKTDTVMVDRDVHFEQIAHVVGIDLNQLKDLNPQYRQDLVNGNSHLSSLRLPADLINTFIDREDSVYAYNADSYITKRKEVKIDDNARYIVDRNQVTRVTTSSRDDDESVESAEEPEVSKSSSRKATRSKRESRRDKRSDRSSRKKKERKERSKNVTVKSGDTLSEIAERNGTTVKKLRKLNGISGNTIHAGKKIKVK